jgi:hypothetical protein
MEAKKMPRYKMLNDMGYTYDEFGVKDEADSIGGLIAEKILAKVFDYGFIVGHDDYSQPKSSLATKTNTAIVYPEFYHNVRPADWVKVIRTAVEDYGDQESIRIESIPRRLDEKKYPLYQEIYRMYHEYSDPDWDGYDAIAISENTFKQAQEFAQMLPAEIPLPDVMPEPTGDIAFEWYQDPEHVLGVSVSEDGTLSYAGLFGKHCQTHGMERLTEHIPQILINHIKRLFI